MSWEDSSPSAANSQTIESCTHQPPATCRPMAIPLRHGFEMLQVSFAGKVRGVQKADFRSQASPHHGSQTVSTMLLAHGYMQVPVAGQGTWMQRTRKWSKPPLAASRTISRGRAMVTRAFDNTLPEVLLCCQRVSMEVNRRSQQLHVLYI
jgi:hypothetical protein